MNCKNASDIATKSVAEFFTKNHKGSLYQPPTKFIGLKLKNREAHEMICDCCGETCDCCGYDC